MTASTVDLPAARSELYERNRAAIDRINRLLDGGRVADDRVADASLMLGSKHRRIGALLLDTDRERARAEMRDAATHTLEGIRRKRAQIGTQYDFPHWEAEPLDLRDALYAAIIAQDDDLGQQALDAITRLDTAYLELYPQTTAWYYYIRLLAAMFEGDLPAQWTALERLRDTVSELQTTQNQLADLFSGIVTVCNGLGARDPDLVWEGLEAVHAFHLEATAEKSGTVRRIRDLHTVVLAMVANQLGLAE